MSKISFVYTIFNCNDDETYVGSTTQTIQKRFQDHLYNCHNDNLKYLRVYEKITALGKEKFKVDLLETVQYNDKYELYARENFFMDELKPCLNARPAPDKNYNGYEKNKEARLQWCKEYYQENRERIIERVHKYAENNKDKIRKKGKKYREEHSDEIKAKKSEQIECECGLTYTNAHRLRHIRTNQHNKLMKSRQV